jgi:predicted transcriptional regulator
MTASTTLTMRVSPDLKSRLGRLAKSTRRSQSFLAAEAVEAYVERELAMIEAIEQGREAVRRGDTVSQDEAEAGIEAVLARHDRGA